MEVSIIGAGIGGLTLALALHKQGIACQVYESTAQIKPVGVGITLLPHCTGVLGELGLQEALSKVAVTTRESVFFNRFGQKIHSEPTGIFAGYHTPQYQIHRGDLQSVLLAAFRERIGDACLHPGWRCTGFTQDSDAVLAHFVDPQGNALPSKKSDVLIACDGLHSAVRKQIHPDEGEPVYSGVNMWRGVTRTRPFLGGDTYVRGGWLTTGKMVIYPIRNNIDEQGNQLINWVAEIETPHYKRRDWNRAGKLEDFIGAFDDWHFDWLDVSALIRNADMILEFPMIDQDPLPYWNQGRVTLLGDAAHPMVPRGSNGAGQAILDAQALARELAGQGSVQDALQAYQDKRLAATTNIVLTNRVAPPDAILGEVYRRTGDKPFDNIDDVISREELLAITDKYKKVAGYDRAALGVRSA